MNIISVKRIFRDLKAYLHSKEMFSKMNIFHCQPKSQKFPVLSNSVPQDQDNETISDGIYKQVSGHDLSTGEIKLTHHLNHRRQKTEKYLFYRIFVLPKFTLQGLIYTVMYKEHHTLLCKCSSRSNSAKILIEGLRQKVRNFKTQFTNVSTHPGA